MIERIENGLQLAVLAVCIVSAFWRVVHYRSRTWILLTLFFGSWALGDLYWTVCLLYYGKTPQISVVSDLSWYASYVFLYLLLRRNAPPQGAVSKRLLPWLGVVVPVGMAGFFMQWGAIASNLIYALLMVLLLYSALRRIAERSSYPGQLPLCLTITVFCLLEYGLWTASCFFEGDTLMNPYYWFDLLLTASFPFFLPATKKAVTA